LHNHRAAFLALPALVLQVRNLLDSVPVLVEASEIPAHSGPRTLDIIERGMCNQDGTSVVPSSIANRTPRMVSHAGLPTEERLIGTPLAARRNLRLDGRPFLQAAQEFLFCHHVNGGVARLTVTSKDGAIFAQRHRCGFPLRLIDLNLFLN
jgi:hypothetical protein